MTVPERSDQVTDIGSGRVRKVRSLAERSVRKRTGLILVEGPGAVSELVEWKAQHVRDVYFTPAAAQRHGEVFASACENVRWVHYVSQQVADHMSPDCQGIVAVADKAAIDTDLQQSLLNHPQLALVLAQTGDPGNLGTMIRQADAFGANLVVACKGCAEVTSPKVIRASAGSVFHLPIAVGITLADAVVELGGAGLPLLASDAHTPLSLPQLLTQTHPISLKQPHAWLMGNEAHGLSPQQLQLCAQTVRIPLYGRAESLNVASAAAVLLYTSAQAQRS